MVKLQYWLHVIMKDCNEPPLLQFVDRELMQFFTGSKLSQTALDFTGLLWPASHCSKLNLKFLHRIN